MLKAYQNEYRLKENAVKQTFNIESEGSNKKVEVKGDNKEKIVLKQKNKVKLEMFEEELKEYNWNCYKSSWKE